MLVFGTPDDVFAMAVEIEKNGKAFYEGAASKADNEDVKKLFTELAAMEEGHITLFSALRSTLGESISDHVWDPEGLAESYLQATADTHIFGTKEAVERLKNVDTVEDALNMAIQFEKDSVAYFLGMKKLFGPRKEKADIDQLIEQEQDHVRMLSAAKRNLKLTGAASVTGAEDTPAVPDKKERPKSF